MKYTHITKRIALILASVLLLREPMQSVEAIGAVLILGAAVVSEVQLPQKSKKGEEQ